MAPEAISVPASNVTPAISVPATLATGGLGGRKAVVGSAPSVVPLTTHSVTLGSAVGDQ